MWNWIANNDEPLSVILNAAMLVVWGLYFQLLLNGYRRSRRCKILINRANGHSLGTQCVVTNMSAEAIYIEGIIAEIFGDDGPGIICSLTDRGGSIDPKQISEEDGYQGPLGSGESVALGSYKKIIRHALSVDDWDISRLRRLKLTVVATYGPEDQSVAAQREYKVVEKEGRRILCSDTVTTRQIRTATERAKIERQIEEEVGARAMNGE